VISPVGKLGMILAFGKHPQEIWNCISDHQTCAICFFLLLSSEADVPGVSMGMHVTLDSQTSWCL